MRNCIKRISVISNTVVGLIVLIGCDGSNFKHQKVNAGKFYDTISKKCDLFDFFERYKTGYGMTYKYHLDYTRHEGNIYDEDGYVFTVFNTSNYWFTAIKYSGSCWDKGTRMVDYNFDTFLNMTKEQFTIRYSGSENYSHFWFINPFTYKSVYTFTDEYSITTTETRIIEFYDYGLIKEYSEVCKTTYSKSDYTITKFTAHYTW